MAISKEAEASPGETARRHFHWCLAGVLLPVIALPFEWALALAHRRSSDTTPEHRRWSRWLFGVAVIDTIIAGLVIALFASGVWGWSTVTERPRRSAAGEAVRIGALIAANPENPNEAQITIVDTDSPAERAGLQPGDVLISLDGDPIRTVDDLPSRIRSGPPGVPRTLRIRRAGEEAEIVVTPERRDAIRDRGATAQRGAAATPPCIVDFVFYAKTLVRWKGLWAAASLMMLLWLVARRVQRRAPPLWSWVVASLGSEALVGALALSGVCLVAGRTTEGTLLVRLTQSVTLLVVGLVAMRRMASAGLLDAHREPVLGAGRAVLLGFFYLAVFNVRLSIFITAFEAFGHVRLPIMTEETVVSGFPSLRWQGQFLVALTVAVVAPMAEEVLFRGVVLPRLEPWMGAAWAVVASSAVFAVLHEGFGHDPFGIRTADVFFVALVLGWARLRTRGLAAPITMHVVTNALSLLAHR